MQTMDNDGRPLQDGSPEPTHDGSAAQSLDERVPHVTTFQEIDAAPSQPIHVPIEVPGEEPQASEPIAASQEQVAEAPVEDVAPAAQQEAPVTPEVPAQSVDQRPSVQAQPQDQPQAQPVQQEQQDQAAQREQQVGPAQQGQQVEPTQQVQQDQVAQQEQQDQAAQRAVAALSTWISLSPKMRTGEVRAFRHPEFELTPQVNEDGTLTHAFKVGGCYFLLWYSEGFPRWRQNGNLPVRVYFVAPKLSEYRWQANRMPFRLYKDHTGQVFVSDRQFENAFRRLLSHHNAAPMAEAAIDLAARWVRYALRPAQQPLQGGRGQQAWRDNQGQRGRQRGMGLPATGRAQSSMRLERPTFLDGRSSLGFQAPPDCRKIVFSDRAFAQIYTETQARIQTETGGLLLGHYDHGTWYVIETSDPGWRGVFEVAYHEGDGEYENHVAAIMARLYRHPLVFLGMWHRHPGSLDTFSGTDDVTNWGYVDSCSAQGCISGLINYDPEFRMTFYYCEHADAAMRYTKVDVEVGDDKFERPELLALASKQDVDQRSWR